jgi:tetratricopeptide (TPR) repeat protein
LARNDFVEQTFMLREAGISAAETGNWAEAVRWFDAAQAAGAKLVSDSLAMMALGLVADRGIAEFKAGDFPKAIASLTKALEGLSEFDAGSSLKAGYLHRVIRHAILCVNLRIGDKLLLVPEQEAAIARGMCSNPEPTDMSDLPLGHIDFAWYMLAEAEIEGDAGRSVADSLRRRLGGKAIPSMETSLRTARIASSIKHSDAQGLLANLQNWIEALFYVQGLGQRFRDFSPLNPTYDEIPGATLDQSTSPAGQRHLADAFFAFGIAAGLQNRPDALHELSSAMLMREYSSDLNRIVGIMAGTVETDAQPKQSLEAAVRQVVANGSDIQPDEVFVAGLRMIQFIERSTLSTVLAPLLANWLRERWTHAVDEQAFLLRSPATNIPAIKQVLGMKERSLQYCAHLLATVAPAAATRLDETFRTYLTNLSVPKPSPAAQG